MSDVFTPQFVVQLVLMFSAAGAVYGGIRSDLKHMNTDIERHGRAISKAPSGLVEKCGATPCV